MIKGVKMKKIHYGVKLLVVPEVASNDESHATIGRMIKGALTRKLEEDDVLDYLRQNGFMIEVHLKSLTKKDQQDIKAG